MQLVLDWLNGSRNFFVGRSLYKTFGSDELLKKQFECGATDFNKTKLIDELEKLCKGNTSSSIKNTEEKNIPKSIASIEPGFDDISKQLEADWKKLYSEMKLYQHKLDEYGTDNSQLVRDACFEICKTIKELERKMMVAVETYEYYKLNKKLPDTKVKEIEIPTDKLLLHKLISNCSVYIRRYRYATNAKHIELFKNYWELYKKATGKEYEFKN